MEMKSLKKETNLWSITDEELHTPCNCHVTGELTWSLIVLLQDSNHPSVDVLNRIIRNSNCERQFI